jgi:AcrR family transcriptional regulator
MAREKNQHNVMKHTLREESILQAAAACFGEQGYRATTLETVAERLGISRVTLYRYCPSKEELLIRVFERSIAIFQRGLQQIWHKEIQSEEKVRQIIRHCVSWRIIVISRCFSEESHLPAEMAERARAERRTYDFLIEGVIRRRRGGGVGAARRNFFLRDLGMCNWLYQWYQPDGPLFRR